MGSYFGAGSLAGADGQTAVIPEPWTAAWHWIYDGVWADHFIPSQAVRSGAPFSSDSFNSGNVAMALTHLGYTCCLTSAGNWDLAAVPSHNGQVTANVDAGTFFILKSTRHPDEAFQVLTYLVGEAAPALLPLYGGLPARTADQEAFVAGLNAQSPQAVDWQVALDSLAYADHPSYAGYLPNYTAALTRLDGFRNLLFATEGVNLDVEIEALQADLQQVFDQD
jgi:multiple sugar transport system substrate-binding protein